MIESNKEIKDIILKSPNSIDQLLSKEILQLSLKDRNAVHEEIHGVSTLAPTETPDFLKASLHELSKELNEISNDTKMSYLESQILPNTYVNTSNFRLRFLRCELFDAKKAAVRMVKFLDVASHFFGPTVLERPVKLMDFTKEGKKFMQAGNVQILPYRDQSGRQIVACVGDVGFQPGIAYKRWKSIFYFVYKISEDIETQQKGIVAVSYPNNVGIPGWEQMEYSKRMHEASPLRKCSVHWCMPPNLPSFHPMNVVRCGQALAWGKGQQVRVKFHVGGRVELLYKLKTYGIPIECIPVTETGNVKTTYLKQWMRGQNNLENAREQGCLDVASIIICPGSADVVFQSGNSHKCHPGNAMFESMVEAKVRDHAHASSTEKAAITKSLISTVQNNKGRFLAWNKQGWWDELKDHPQIHIKVVEKVRRLTNRMVAQRKSSRSSTAIFQNQDNSKRRKIISPDDSNDGTPDDSICVQRCWFEIDCDQTLKEL